MTSVSNSDIYLAQVKDTYTFLYYHNAAIGVFPLEPEHMMYIQGYIDGAVSANLKTNVYNGIPLKYQNNMELDYEMERLNSESIEGLVRGLCPFAKSQLQFEYPEYLKD